MIIDEMYFFPVYGTEQDDDFHSISFPPKSDAGSNGNINSDGYD